MNLEQLANCLGLAQIENISTDLKSYEVIYKLPPVCSRTQISFFRFMNKRELAFHIICDFAQELGEDIFEPVDSDSLLKLDGFQKFIELNEFAQNSYRVYVCQYQFKLMLKSAIKLISYEGIIDLVNLIMVEDILES
jgi:hypothetical protein